MKDRTPNELADAYSRPFRLAELFTLAYWRIWYARECGGRETLRLAIPIIISWSSVTVMTITDRLCLAWYGQTEMNASFQASCLFWGLICFPQGIGVFVNTFVAQYYGANQKKRIGSVIWQGVFIGLAFGLLFIAATPFIEPFFRAIGQSAELAALEKAYWKYMALAAVASLGLESLQSFFNGIRETKLVMKLTILGFAVNMVLDPILIFGINGRLELGVEGAAIATAIAMWIKFAAFVYYTVKRDRNGEYGIRSSLKLNFHEMKRLFSFGSMSALQTSAEQWFYTLFVLVMGWFGEEASAATAIAYNMNSLLYMPAIGFGVATSTIVGNVVGAGRQELVGRATRTAMALASVVAGVFSILFLTVPEFFVNIYTMREPETFAATRPLATNILRIVGIYLVADAYNLILASALRGAGDARFIMIATFAVVASIVVAMFGGVFGFGLGVYWCWALQVTYLLVNITVFGLRLRSGKWRDKGLVETNANLV
ncbi:MAG: MATE family efflux transporter [Thermoguttaceae bacterium]|nr:MATE family efflux transporter [Thermoguttaceae bacterium]